MSVIRSNPPAKGEALSRVPATDSIYRFLSSVRFTMLVLPFIAASCVLGTLVKQQATPEEYLAQFSDSTYAILRFLRITDVFHAPWFLLLIGLFVVNLVFCTIDRLSLLLRSAGEKKLPNEKTLSAMSQTFLLPGKRVEDVARLFRGYKRAGVYDNGQVLEKGGIARYGVYVIHGSIIVILAGSLIGLIAGFRGSLTLAKGEMRDAVFKRGAAQATIPLGFAIRCDDFKVAFYPSGEPKDYVSRIAVIDHGHPVKEAEVRVNHPLTYKGTSIYQASYGSNPVFRFSVAGKEVSLIQGSVYKEDGLTMMVMRFEKSIHNFGPGVQIAYVEGKESKASWFLKDVPRLREKEIMGVPVRLDDVREDFFTGLEIAHDPGVWVVWVGFAMILCGLFVNFFFYYRRVYLLQTSSGVLVAGVSPRNKDAFKQEFEKWRDRLNGNK